MIHLMAWLGTTDPNVIDVFKYVGQGGMIGLLTLVILGGAKRWWVFGWQFKDLETRITKIEAERDEWRELALQGTSLAERTVDLFRHK